MSLDAILKQYENNNKSNASKKKMTDADRLKQYFTTFLKEGVNSATKRIRILPVGENQSPFVEVMGHKIQVGGQWRTFVCPKHETDSECPFCEAREELLASGSESDKEIAKKYSAKKMYVVKVIDREREDEGPKFWRFNHDYRKTGIFDKIFGVLQAVSTSVAADITSIENGRDLIVTIARDQNGMPTVNSIVNLDPSPLHADAETVKNWLDDERTWNDVYAVKPYSYLEIIVKGGEPAWKKNASGEGGEWVDKNSLSTEEGTYTEGDDELTIGKDALDADLTVDTSEATTTEDEEEDDLPF